MKDQGFWAFSQILWAYMILVAIAAYTEDAMAMDAAKVLGGAVAAWGAQYLQSRGQTSKIV